MSHALIAIGALIIILLLTCLTMAKLNRDDLEEFEDGDITDVIQSI